IDFDPNWWVDDPIDTDNTGGTFTEVIDGFASEGTHHLGMASGRRVKQTLPGVGLEPNTVYTFTVGVGNRDGFGAADNASVFGLQVGGSPLADFQSINSTDIPVGTFVDYSWIYITGSDPAPGDIEVVVGSDAGGRGHFDNVRVDATPVSDGGNLLLLEIVDGVATIKNGPGNDPFDIDYYEISSPSGSLNIGGWNSLEDQDYEGNGAPGSGNGWEELGNLDNSLLAEFYLTGSSVLAPNTEINLGNIWTGAAEDLSFNYHLEDGGVVPGIVTYDGGGGGGVDGDFNDDGAYDCADIDALVAEIAGGTNNAAFDLNADGSVDTADRDAWLSEAGEANLGPGKTYLMGDATLDGFVDVSDFGAWNANKFTATAAWCSGDFTADGVVDVSDFGAWNSNKFTASDSAAAAVPEPAGMAIMLVLGAGMLVFRRK
ncbi:MAG: PEP-CTERM sorting domain-containing protein, partial [Planctomycetota bacterium]